LFRFILIEDPSKATARIGSAKRNSNKRHAGPLGCLLPQAGQGTVCKILNEQEVKPEFDFPLASLRAIHPNKSIAR
jgi:hypothetical protein